MPDNFRFAGQAGVTHVVVTSPTIFVAATVIQDRSDAHRHANVVASVTIVPHSFRKNAASNHPKAI
ncbi:hypothetical protein [Mesorhizobium sp. WSM3860]|uniref:hypothetical protein n=1 Tax=Mesorhizobium sp. WSM3860 TaxID=2029403 RepID=UPI001140E670|nr:hypothetical protein [Mesorhizobium sp. WSM3860]